MFQDFIQAFFLVFIAEMGDKSQILAMAFATKFPVKKVMMGVFAGALLNHGLAVLLGSFIQDYIPITSLQIIAGFAFVVFALWSLKPEDDEEEETDKKMKFGPILTVAIAYFLGELGDKTQLTAIALSANSQFPWLILTGTVLGMTTTSGIGVFVGKKLGDKIPEFTIRIVAGSIFMFFGILKLFQSLPERFITAPYLTTFFGVVGIITFFLVSRSIKQRKEGKTTLLQKKAKELYDYYNKMNEEADILCLGLDICKYCQGNECVVGQIKNIVKIGLEEDYVRTFSTKTLNLETLNKNFDRQKVIQSLKNTVHSIKAIAKIEEKDNIHNIRKNLELILFGKSIEKFENWENYKQKLLEIDRITAEKIIKNK